MSTLALGLSGLKARELVKKAKLLEDNMEGNVNFPSPSPAIADITAKRLELQSAIAEASFGDHREIKIRKIIASELSDMIRELANYVVFMAKGNENMILSSGFSIRKPNTAISKMPVPSKLKAKRTTYSGTVKLDWNPVHGAKSYHIEMTLTDPTKDCVWTPVAISTRSKAAISGLTPGEYVWFRVRAIGSRLNSGYCEPALVMAA